jgi:hypothetical protein
VIGHSINPRSDGREVILLVGSVLSGILAGIAGATVSLAYGHPTVVTFLLYSFSGCLGMTAFALMSARFHDV